MHQTTVRFGADLWEALEEECAALGVSVAQYLREAALARLAHAAARRGDLDFEHALEFATEGRVRQQPPAAAGPAPAEPATEAATAVERARLEVSDSAALWAQGRQARRRAQELRDKTARARRQG
jgi:hypothetical protein